VEKRNKAREEKKWDEADKMREEIEKKDIRFWMVKKGLK